MDGQVYYYVWLNKDQKPISWLATDTPKRGGLGISVTREEFIAYGGNPDSIVYANPQARDIQSLVEENKLLKAQITAMIDRNQFIEDCIAEMAMEVYS